MRWSTLSSRRYPRLSHRYYPLKAKWLGLEKLQHWDRNAPLPDDDDRRDLLARRARRGCWTPMAPSARNWPRIGSRFFDEPWIDARSAARQVGRRLRASHRAVSASLSADELSRQRRAT